MSERAEHVPSLSVALRSHRDELVRLAKLVDRFAAEHHLSDNDLTNLNLVLDEIVSNVIKYGHLRPHEEPRIDVSLALDGGRLTVNVADDGIAFNPLDAKRPDLDLPIVERPIGGLGIHIVKALVDTIAYRREDGRNHMTLTMRVNKERKDR